LGVPFDARLDGTIRRVAGAGNRAEISIGASLSGGADGTVRVVLDGIALDNGGVQMDHSVAILGTPARPNLYRGSITALDGSRISARVRDGAGHALVLAMLVNVDGSGRTLTGILSARTASA
jgi:hypothetical protein